MCIFGFLIADKKTFQIKNLFLLLFKIYLYEFQSIDFCSLSKKNFLKNLIFWGKNCPINNETKQKRLKKICIKVAHLIQTA